MLDTMNDEQFLWYCTRHSKTERALFSGHDVHRLGNLLGESWVHAQDGGLYCIPWDEMRSFIEQIEALNRDKRRAAIWDQYLAMIDALFVEES
jgi:hypothetical protein